ncbi:MAG: hypothetical protein QGH40_03010 [bacterium]|jgi:hypothetical protein|nr:hypothetical protein [bacterium]
MSFGAVSMLDRLAEKTVPSYQVEHTWGEEFTVSDRLFVPLIRYRSVSFDKESGPVSGGYASVEPVGFLTVKDGQPYWIGFLSDQNLEKGLQSKRDPEPEKEGF